MSPLHGRPYEPHRHPQADRSPACPLRTVSESVQTRRGRRRPVKVTLVHFSVRGAVCPWGHVHQEAASGHFCRGKELSAYVWRQHCRLHETCPPAQKHVKCNNTGRTGKSQPFLVPQTESRRPAPVLPSGPGFTAAVSGERARTCTQEDAQAPTATRALGKANPSSRNVFLESEITI